jgi:hypothetical protein
VGPRIKVSSAATITVSECWNAHQGDCNWSSSYLKSLSLNLGCCYIIECLTLSLVPISLLPSACLDLFTRHEWTRNWGSLQLQVLVCDWYVPKSLLMPNRTTAEGITDFLSVEKFLEPVSFCSCKKVCNVCAQRQEKCAGVEFQKSLLQN